MYVMNGIGQQAGHCPAAPSMCFSAAAERDSARSMCHAGYVPTPPSGPCPSGNVLDPFNLMKFRPCDIAHFGLCSPEEDPGGQVAMLQQQQQHFGPQQAAEEGAVADEKDDYTMYYLIGGAAIVAVGGIAYFMTRKKR